MPYQSPETNFTGYLLGNEDDQDMPVIDFTELTMAPVEIPNAVDPRKFHVVEQQGSVGSCQGCALSSVMEGLAFLQSRKLVSLSKMAAYRFSQLESDPPINTDSGSTLSGGAAAARKGIPLEEHWPYSPNHYPRRIPKDAVANRSEFKVTTAKKLKSNDPAQTIVDWIGSGRGFAVAGFAWDSRTCDKELIDSYRPRGGGHAISLLGYDREDETITIANSWGSSIFDGGYQRVRFSTFNKMMSAGWNTCVMYSDLVFEEDQSREIPDFSAIGRVCR
jgi:C1A family cysteine protease